MADISKITPLGSQTTYNLKDATAREQVLIVADQTTQYNLLPITKIETSQAGNLTIAESGGIITINGTQSGGIAAVGIPFTIKAGQYYVQGCPSGGSDSTYRVDIRTSIGGALYSNDYDYGTGFLLTVSTDTTLVYNIRLNNSTYNNIKVKPMIMTKALHDSGFTDFQPYALPNTKITPELIELVDSGAKNIFNEPVLTTGSAGEINITNNGDGTFTLNTSGATTVNSGVRIGWFTGKQGVTYAVSNYSPSCQLRVRYGSDIILDTTGGTNTFVAPSNARAELIWYIASGTTLTNYLLKPMVCTKVAWDVSQKFVPYRPTYEETVEQVATNKNNISSEQAKTTNIGNATNAVINPYKNRLNYTLSSLKKINTSGSWVDNVYTLNNTTFTVNDDYTITVNSTLTSGNANFFLFSSKNIADLATCILSGCPAVSGASIHCEKAESPYSTICIDTGNSAVISSTTKKTNLYIQISGSVNSIKFEPMICEPVYWSVSHEYAEPNKEVLKGKKILYNGDSICESRLTGFSANGGGYAKLIADETGCFYDNRAVSGGTLAVVEGKHNICTDVTNMPYDGDLICFEGGINDYWNNVPLGNFSETDYTSSITGLDTTTVCGALEAIIRQAIARWTGVPICFVIIHKVVGTAYTANTAGYTFAEMREKMIAILNKYSIPYYDCYAEGGLNGYVWYLNEAYLNGGSSTHPDGCHPDEGGYRRYYVPQLIDLFTRIIPKLK